MEDTGGFFLYDGGGDPRLGGGPGAGEEFYLGTGNGRSGDPILYGEGLYIYSNRRGELLQIDRRGDLGFGDRRVHQDGLMQHWAIRE